MTRTSFIRISGFAGMVAGLFYCSTTIVDLVYPQTPVFTRPTDYLIEGLFVVALLFTLIAYVGIHVLHQGRVNRFETLSFAAVMSGTVGIAIAATATLLVGREVLGPVFLLAVLAALVGSICFGIAIIRGNILPRLVGIAVMLALPLSFVLEAVGGGILLGLVWLLIGYAIATMGSKLITTHRLSM
jgi:drug/metabolite transporter (DMT)-like permease